MSGYAMKRLDYDVWTQMTPNHTTFLVRSYGNVRVCIFCLSGKALTLVASKKLMCVVQAAGWLHSMVLH